MMKMMMMMMMMLTVIDGDDKDGDNNDDWRRRWWWRSKVAMENAFISLVLVIDRKDFEQAHTVGRPISLSATKTYCGFKYLEI